MLGTPDRSWESDGLAEIVLSRGGPVGYDDVRARRGWKYLLGALALVPVLAAATVAGAASAVPAGPARPHLTAPHARPATGPVVDVFLAVACPSSADCVAVGYAGTPNTQRALIEQWNGKGWSALTPPLPANTFSSSLDGISCPTRATCVAVGDALNNKTGFIEPLVVKGSGTSWADLANPGLDAGSGAVLERVSCASATACLAVGDNLTGDGAARAELWNGKQWAVLPPLTPSNAEAVALEDVSCSTATTCMVVGFYDLGGDELTLAESWSGGKWAVLTTPGGSTATLSSVSCVNSSSCMAVGDSATAGSAQLAFAAKWNGKDWTALVARSPAGRASPELEGVSCTSATSCIAVGQTTQTTIVNPTAAPLAETWNGAAWTLVNPPAHVSEVFSAVAATGSSTAIAVGDVDNVVTGEQQTLAERWSGPGWTTLATPSP
jgi:hypothetical protein